MSNKLYVGMFEGAGAVASVNIVRDRATRVEDRTRSFRTADPAAWSVRKFVS